VSQQAQAASQEARKSNQPAVWWRHWAIFLVRCHSIQPLRATVRRAFRGNLRWWANKTSPWGPDSRRREELASLRGSPLGWTRNLEMISAGFRVRA